MGPQQVLERVLDGDLAPMRQYIEVKQTEMYVDTRPSEEYSMPTTYLHTEHIAILTVPRETLQLQAVDLAVPCPTPALSEVLPRNVYRIGDREGTSLFCWLTDDECGSLKDPGVKSALLQWIDAL